MIVVKIENYPTAYKEVYEILKFVPQKDYDKIPRKFIEMIEKNMNKYYNFSINPQIDFVEEQEIMYETRVILAYIFINYWATEQEKEIINIKFKKDIEKAENRKRQIYDVDIFRPNKQVEESKVKKLNLTVTNEKNIIIKIFNKIKSWFKF